MPSTESSPVLADAADVLSDQLRVHLRRMARLLKPIAKDLERRFLNRLRELHFDPKQRKALAAITPGAAASILAGEQAPMRLFEEIEYNGRRLAKLNIPPGAILQALQEYDLLLTPALQKITPSEHENFKWVREQLHFCVVLTLNNAFYQVRESETQAFYELFRAELESKSLEELLHRLLTILAEFSHADAGHLFLLSDDRTAWVVKASVEPASRRSSDGWGRNPAHFRIRPRCRNAFRLSGYCVWAVLQTRFCSIRAGGSTSKPAGPFRWRPEGEQQACFSLDSPKATTGFRASRSCWLPRLNAV